MFLQNKKLSALSFNILIWLTNFSSQLCVDTKVTLFVISFFPHVDQENKLP